MSKTLDQLITAVRQLTLTEYDPAVTDAEITDRLTEALSSLYDLMVAAYEHYAIRTFDFTLAGGITGQSVTLPSDFYKDNSLDRSPQSSPPETVHRLGSWLERNRILPRQYTLLGDDLVIEPASQAAGDYRLYYTPITPSFLDPTIVVATSGDTVTAASRAVVRSILDAAFGPPLNRFQFGSESFTSLDIGRYIYLTGCTNAANNGLHLISTIVSPTVVEVAEVIHDEYLDIGPPVVATMTGNLSTATWHFANANFDSSYIGEDLFVYGASQPVNVGAFEIGDIVSVLDPTRVVTIAGYPLITESFASTVVASSQPFNTLSTLTQTFTPWYEYLQVHAAVAVLEKLKQNTADMELRLERLSQRVQKMAPNRQEEGGQVALTRNTGTSWGPGQDPGWEW